MPTLDYTEQFSLPDGTRKQYSSEWTFIEDKAGAGTGQHAFTHDLGEVPWLVDIIQSDTGDGKNATEAASGVTFTKTDTTITVVNDTGTDRYFKVRAM